MYHAQYTYTQPKIHPSAPQRYAEDIECIIKSPNSHGSLYIGNLQAAQSQSTLRKLSIGAILSCAKGYELSHPLSLVPNYKYIPADDAQHCEISRYFDSGVDFIKKCLQKTNILVHCLAGVSRSVSLVLAYFIREHHMSYEQAYSTVKAKRKIIHPNAGFIRQLKEYERKFLPIGYHNNIPPSRIERSATSDYFTPRKKEIRQIQVTTATNTDHREFNAPPNIYSKSFCSIPDQKHINSITSLENQEAVNLTPSRVKGYFDSMNHQLNDKIDQIRKKYEAERKKINTKYGENKLASYKQRVDPQKEPQKQFEHGAVNYNLDKSDVRLNVTRYQSTDLKPRTTKEPYYYRKYDMPLRAQLSNGFERYLYNVEPYENKYERRYNLGRYN